MIIGHKKIWNLLKSSAELDKLPHALLFIGQEKLGKKKLAIEFLKFLNCSDSDKEKKPCQTCKNCRDIEKNQYPDVFLITPQEKEIRISQIRDLQWNISLKPYLSSIKAVVIDQAHLMNPDAQSSFLKTLEEPKGSTIIILISEYPDMLLPTIRSRCETIKFYPVEKKEMLEFLAKNKISREGMAGGKGIFFDNPGSVMEFLSDPHKSSSREKYLQEITDVSKSDLASRFQYAKELAGKPEELDDILKLWLNYYRNTLLSAVGSKDSVAKDTRYSTEKLSKIINLIQQTHFLLTTTNINTRLALEIIMLEI